MDCYLTSYVSHPDLIYDLSNHLHFRFAGSRRAFTWYRPIHWTLGLLDQRRDAIQKLEHHRTTVTWPQTGLARLTRSWIWEINIYCVSLTLVCYYCPLRMFWNVGRSVSICLTKSNIFAQVIICTCYYLHMLLFTPLHCPLIVILWRHGGHSGDRLMRVKFSIKFGHSNCCIVNT